MGDDKKKAQPPRQSSKLSREEILKQYEFLLDISDSYLSMIDRDYTYLITNEAFCSAYDLNKKDVIGNTPMRVWGKETFFKIIKPYLDESFNSREIRYTRWFDVPGKGHRFFEVTFRPHQDETGEVDFVLVSSRDLTERETARIRLQQQEEDITLLNLVNRLYSEGKDIREITRAIVEQITRIFHAFSSNIFLVDDLAPELRPPDFFVPPEVLQESGVRLNNLAFRKGFGSSSMFRYVLRKKKVVHLNRAEEIDRVIRDLTDERKIRDKLLGLLKNYGVNSMLIVPLVKEGEGIGVLGIARNKPFTEEETDRIRKLGYQMIVVLKRKKEEQRIREQSERIRLLFETSDDAIFLIKENRILDCNPAAVRIFEAGKKTRLIGENPLRLFPVQQENGRFSEFEAQTLFMRVMEGKLATFEFLHKTFKGKDFFAQVKLNRLEIGGEYYIQAVVRDIDKEKRTRIMLENSERSLREAQRIAHLGDWYWDLESGEVRWSEEFFRILKYDPRKDKPSLKLFASRIHPDDRRRVLEKISGAVAKCRKKCTDQFRLVMPDGTMRYVASSGVLEQHNGVPHKWHGTVHDITPLKEAELALRESEERFRKIFTEGFYAMCVVSPDETFEVVNRAFVKLLGYSAKELKSVRFPSLVVSRDKEEKNCRMLKDIFSGKVHVFSGEVTYRNKKGRLIVTQTGLTALLDEQGRIKNIVVMIMDITARKEAEKKILYQTHELSLINRLNLELNRGTSLREIVRIFDGLLKELYPIDHTLVYLREPFEEEFHLAFSTLQKKQEKNLEQRFRLAMFDAVPSRRFEQIMEQLGKDGPVMFINTPEKMQQFIDLFFTDEKMRPKAMGIREEIGINTFIVYPIREGDELRGFITLNSRQTLGHEIFESLSGILDQVVMVFLKKISENETKRLYDAIEQLGEVLIVSDRRGRIVYVNMAVQKVLGFGRDTLVGNFLNIFRHPGEDPSFYENIWNTVFRGHTWVGVHRLLRSDGKTVKTRTNITPILDEQGKVLYFVTILRDVTKELALEHYLQRTQKLEMMGRFAGGLAHDFNNMLATVMGYVEIVMDETDPESQVYRYLEKAITSGKKAGEVIRQLLTFNRGIEPEKKKTGIADLVRDTLVLLKPQIPRRVTVTIEDHTKEKKVLVDPAQMRQVFLNLISNAAYAVKDKENGSIRITLDILNISQENENRYPELNGGEWLLVRILDNGIGIAGENLDKVFDPFFTTKPVGKGSGMGLSVVHGIVQNHNGVVHIDSTPGKGTAFTVFLPADKG